MSSADILHSQREEINRCAQRRERLLRSLFGVTQSFLRITEPTYNASNVDPDKQEHDLSAFLDLNDISQNRFFDPSTLPSPQHLRLSFPSQRRQNESIDNRSGREHSPKAASSRTQPLQQGNPQDSENGRQLERDAEGGKPESHTTDPSLQKVSASGAGTVHTQKDGGEVDQYEASSNAKEPDAAGIQLSTSNQLSENFQSRQRDEQEREGQTTSLTPPNSGRSLQEVGEKLKKPETQAAHGSQDEEQRNVFPTAQDTTKQSPRLSAETSNGQVKAGERDSLSGNAADLPSRYIQHTLDEDHTIMDISPFHEESGRSQRDTSLIDQGTLEQRPTIALRNTTISGLSGDSNQDPTFSRRPPMRIDTTAASQMKDVVVTAGKATTTVSEAGTPSKSAPVSAQSPPERTTTRLSSGALQHRSVSEILGETPRAVPSSRRVGNESARSDQTHLQSPMSSSPTTPKDISAFRRRLSEMKEKERSKLSTVIFAKPQSSGGARLSDAQLRLQAEGEQQISEPRDYFLTFFAAQIYQAPRATPLAGLIRQAHKNLGTPDHFLEIREKQDFKVLNYIKEMQHSNRWSLRQMDRASEPQRPASHWDILLGQMKWMRTDYREERKFKIAGSRHLAEACAAWVSATADERRKMEVKIRHEPVRRNSQSISLTPELVPDETSEITEDETPALDPMISDPPAAIFSLPPDHFVFGLNQSPVAEKILLELPCYQPARDLEDSVLSIRQIDPDFAWKSPLVPVSKYAKGKLVSSEEGPPKKRPRLEAPDATSRNSPPEIETSASLAPGTEDVALFNPENRHVRDRIHAGHAFRPPSEYQMPSRDFFEWRAPSQWTPAEDDELRKLVREYSYNWSLISSCLTPSALYTSGGERRTPWECFERWISLEGLPAEMSKVPYFRTYHQRLSQAARTVEARQQASLQSQNANPAALPHRRRSNQPYTVEKRKNNRPIHLVDAMRKHAKKKEAALHKQQQQATLGAMRKNNEVPKERKSIPTAREMSRIKHERQVKMEEQNRLLRMQYATNAQNAKKAVQQQGSAQMNGNPANRNAVPGLPNGAASNAASAAPHMRGAAVDSRTNASQMHRAMSGQLNGAPAPGRGLPNTPMQPQMQVPMGQRLPQQMPNDMRLYQEAERVQAQQQQQAFLQQRQQHRLPQTNGHSASPNMQNAPLANAQSNPAMLASMQGRASPSTNGNQTSGATSTSPRASHSQPQTLSSGVTPAVSQIQNQVKIQHPSAPPEEIQRLTTQQLVRMSQQQSMNQQAMAAAVGNSGGSLTAMPAPNPMLQNQQAVYSNGNNSQFSQQQYTAYMHSQQATQSRAVSSGSATAPGISNSRSVTPHVQRTGSAQGGGPPRGPSQSPRQGPIGVSGSQ